MSHLIKRILFTVCMLFSPLLAANVSCLIIDKHNICPGKTRVFPEYDSIKNKFNPPDYLVLTTSYKEHAKCKLDVDCELGVAGKKQKLKLDNDGQYKMLFLFYQERDILNKEVENIRAIGNSHMGDEVFVKKSKESIKPLRKVIDDYIEAVETAGYVKIIHKRFNNCKKGTTVPQIDPFNKKQKGDFSLLESFIRNCKELVFIGEDDSEVIKSLFAKAGKEVEVYREGLKDLKTDNLTADKNSKNVLEKIQTYLKNYNYLSIAESELFGFCKDEKHFSRLLFDEHEKITLDSSGRFKMFVERCSKLELNPEQTAQMIVALHKTSKITNGYSSKLNLDDNQYTEQYKEVVQNISDVNKIIYEYGSDTILSTKTRQEKLQEKTLKEYEQCLQTYPVVLLQKTDSENAKSLTDFKSKLEGYVQQCQKAIQYLVKVNNTDKLQKYREAIKRSIASINTSITILSNASIQNSGNLSDAFSISRDIQRSTDKLELLLGTGSDLPLLANWRAEPFTYQFYVGAEASKVSDFDTSANARLGLLTYIRPGKKRQFVNSYIKDCEDASVPCGDFGWYVPHWFFTGFYSSSAEQSPGNAGNGDKNESVLEWDSGFFWPVLYSVRGSGKNRTEFMFGPIYSRGGRAIEYPKSDANAGKSSKFLDRYYRGIRMAFNEESYFDLMIGHSENINKTNEKRWEIRGQFPVSKLGGGRVFVGGRINFGHNDKEYPTAKDSYNLYVMWQTSFDDLWAKPTGK